MVQFLQYFCPVIKNVNLRDDKEEIVFDRRGRNNARIVARRLRNTGRRPGAAGQGGTYAAAGTGVCAAAQQHTQERIN